MENFSVENDRLIFRGHTDIGACYREDDGFFVWSPKGGTGVYNANDLRMIMEFLNELNSEWEEFIKNNLR